MPFATLNGWSLPIRHTAASMGREPIGDVGVRWRNRQSRERKAIPRSWEMTACLMTKEDATTLEGLILGRAHHWPFDSDTYSTTGIGAEAGGTQSIVFDSADSKFGVGYLSVTSTTWNPNLHPGKWTIMYWRGGGGAWEHVTVRHDGAKWLDGVRNDALVTTELTVAPPAFSLASVDVDDMAVFHFAASDAFIVATYTWSAAGRPLSDFPRMILEGDSVNGEATVIGDLKSQTNVALANVDTERDVSFTLSEEKQPEVTRIPAPVVGFHFDNEHRDGAEFKATHGPYIATETGAGSNVPGPFGIGGAWDQPGSAGERIDLTQDAIGVLEGARVVSMSAWVRRDGGGGSTQAIFDSQTAPSANEKLAFQITALDAIQVAARSTDGEAAQVATSATSLFSGTVEFALIGIVVDFAGDVIDIYQDGVLVKTQAVTFTSSTLASGIGATNRLLQLTSGLSEWNGRIASFHLWRRRLTAQQWLAMYNNGKLGFVV